MQLFDACNSHSVSPPTCVAFFHLHVTLVFFCAVSCEGGLKSGNETNMHPSRCLQIGNETIMYPHTACRLGMRLTKLGMRLMHLAVPSD